MSLCFSNNGIHILVTGVNCQIAIYNLASKEIVFIVELTNYWAIMNSCFNQDDTLVAVGCANGKTVIINIVTKEYIYEISHET